MNKTVAACVTEREVKILDEIAENGYYTSRSDVVRTFVRKGIREYELSKKREIPENPDTQKE